MGLHAIPEAEPALRAHGMCVKSPRTAANHAITIMASRLSKKSTGGKYAQSHNPGIGILIESLAIANMWQLSQLS